MTTQKLNELKQKESLKDTDDTAQFDEMISYKNTFEDKLEIDRSLESYGAIVHPKNVYSAAEEFTTRQLRGLSKWYGQRLETKDNPAMITVKILIDDVISKREQTKTQSVNIKKNKKSKPKRKSAKDEFKVGDVFKVAGNMESPATIRKVKGNSLYFTDANGVSYAGFSRATARELVKGGEWKKIISEPEKNDKELNLLTEEAGNVLDIQKSLSAQYFDEEGNVQVDWFRNGEDLKQFVKLKPENKLLRVHQTTKFGMGSKVEKTLYNKAKDPISFKDFYNRITTLGKIKTDREFKDELSQEMSL